jgi:DNA polymerase-3 subunit gamma/tau
LVDVIAIRQMWPDVVERVKTYKRVTWMLLMEQVQVASVDDRVLVLAFTNEGKRRGFAASGHDEIVRQALIDVLGLDRRIDAVLDPKAAEASPPPAAPVASAPEPTPEPPHANEPPAKPAAAAPAEPAPRSETAESVDVSEVGEQDDDEVLDPGLSGAQLIQRELGGRVISESGPA